MIPFIDKVNKPSQSQTTILTNVTIDNKLVYTINNNTLTITNNMTENEFNDYIVSYIVKTIIIKKKKAQIRVLQFL